MKFRPCRNKTLPQLVSIADWCSIHALLQYPNSAVQTSSLLSKPGAKINGQYYPDVLLMQKLLPAIRSIAGDVFVFQQYNDNAPALRARDTIELLCSKTPQYISPDMWPANSPDFNPIDYRIWDMLQENVYRAPIHNTDELQKRLIATWAEFQHSMVDDAVVQCRKRLEACIRAERSHFEHLLWHSSCHTSQPVLFRAASANPQPAIFRATNVWRYTTFASVRWKILAFTR